MNTYVFVQSWLYMFIIKSCFHCLAPLSSRTVFVTTKKILFIDYLRALSCVFQERINPSSVFFLSLKLLKIKVNNSWIVLTLALCICQFEQCIVCFWRLCNSPISDKGKMWLIISLSNILMSQLLLFWWIFCAYCFFNSSRMQEVKKKYNAKPRTNFKVTQKESQLLKGATWPAIWSCMILLHVLVLIGFTRWLAWMINITADWYRSCANVKTQKMSRIPKICSLWHCHTRLPLFVFDWILWLNQFWVRS